jgi:predicted SnoaL-like aldol condensation-catalyzing enzyme
MSAENKACARRFYDEAINGGDVALIDELVAADFVEHEGFPGLADGRKGVKQFFNMMRYQTSEAAS